MIKNSAVLILGATALLLQGCGGGGDGGSGTGTGGGGAGTGNQPPPAPTVSLDSDTASARVGDKVKLSWNSLNATSCSASGGWTGGRGVAGSESVDLTTVGTANFTLTCTGTGGSASASKSVTTGAAMTQLSIPGAPAPINVSKGECVASSDENIEVRCITSAADIPAKYESFSSTLSGRSVGSLTTTPTTTAGGACSAGFDRVQSRLFIDTTIRDHAFTVTGSSISEFRYKPALLSSLSQGQVTEMSVLYFQDNSDTDRMGYALYGVVSGEPVVMVGAGTITSEGNFDIVSCIDDGNDVTPPPPPPPPPGSLSCSEASGPGTNGLGFYGTTSYNISGSTPNATTPRTLGWGVRYNNPNLSSASFTGSLRVRLWALPRSYSGGDFTGYPLFAAKPNFTGAGAKSVNQLYNFYSVTDIQSSGTGQNPPAGKYCLVATLDEYSDSCSSTDKYCTVDWGQFAGAVSFP
jgi:hypothetical protein